MFDHLVTGNVARWAVNAQTAVKDSCGHVIIFRTPSPVHVTVAIHHLEVGATECEDTTYQALVW